MLRFRPHHFLCTLGFQGHGYSEEFVRNYRELADSLRRDPESGDHVRIEVVSSTDSICAPCPNRSGSLCATEQKIRSLDDAHAAVLGISPGQVVSWGEAKRRIAERMTDEAFDRACAPCSWKSMGVCAAALKELQSHAQGKTP